MKDESPEADSGRLLELSEEVGRIAGSLTRLSIGLRASLQRVCSSSNPNEPHVLLERVRWLIDARRKRARYIAPDLLVDPAWDILLDLLRAELSYERPSVSSTCSAAGVPASTGLRWLNALEQRGLVLRQENPRDANGTLLVLSPETSAALRRYFVEVVAAK
jgi:DNA-binding MarR family transcriptional regulator